MRKNFVYGFLLFFVALHTLALSHSVRHHAVEELAQPVHHAATTTDDIPARHVQHTAHGCALFQFASSAVDLSTPTFFVSHDHTVEIEPSFHVALPTIFAWAYASRAPPSLS